MARESQEARLGRIRTRVNNARRWRDNEGYNALWRRMTDLYRGRHWEGFALGESDLVVVNLCFATANVVQASVTTQYPKFTVSASKVGFEDQATIAESVLNYYWRHYDFHEQFRRAVKDFVVFGHGWLKVGWRYAEREEETKVGPDVLLAERETTNVALDLQAMAEPETAGELPTPEEVADEQDTEEERTEIVVLTDDPSVERVSPFDIFVDPEATGLGDMRWIAQRIIRTVEEVREDPTYEPRARRRVEPDMSTLVTDGSSEDTYDYFEEADEPDRVTVWEFYDLVENEWCVFAQSGDLFLRKPGPIPYPYPCPFVMFRNYDVPDEFYPMGELEQIEPLQEEINKTRSQAVDARKHFVRKFIARASALDQRAKQALASDRDGEVVLLSDDNVPLEQVVIHAPHLQFDPNVFNQWSSQIQQDLQTVTGLSDYQFGQMPDTRRLATEASIVEGATNARASFKLAQIERTLADVGRYLLLATRAFLESTRAARIAGPGGELLFEYDAGDLEGEFDLAVEAGSTQPKNDMLRRQEALALFNTLAPFMGTVVDPQEAIRYLLQNGYDIQNVDRFFIPPQPALGPGGMVPPGGAPGGGPGVEPAVPGGPGEVAAPPPETAANNVIPMAG